MNYYQLHINFFDLLCMGAALIGLAFSVRLWFKKSDGDNHRLFSLILFVIALWLVRVICIDTRLVNYFPRWIWISLQFLLSIGPLLFLYVRSILRPDQKLTRKDLLDTSTDKLIQRGYWLRHQMKVHRFYLDADLSLNSLAKALGISIHELSKIINTGLRKNFNDFVNEFRIQDVARKMKDPGYDRITLLGIAYDCGFNSKTTFNRAFKQITGKSPAEYIRANSKKSDQIMIWNLFTGPQR